MPAGGGLRKCKCGQLYLLSEAIYLGVESRPETPHTPFVDAADLADATRSTRKPVERKRPAIPSIFPINTLA